MKNLFVPEDERFDVSFWRRFVQSALAFSYDGTTRRKRS